MRALVAGLAAGLVTLAAIARPNAQPTDPRELREAKGLYDDANVEMTVGRYLDALHDYTAAYDLTHDPVLFYKIGTAAEKAGKCDSALIYYTRYVREAKPDARFLELVKERVKACGGDPRSLDATTTDAGSGAGSGSAAVVAPDTGAGSGSAQATTPAPSGPPRAHANNHDGAWLLVGGALTFVTAGVVLAYSASSSEQDIRDLYVGVGGAVPTYNTTTAQRYQDLIDEGHRYQYLSWAAFGIATGLAAGAAAWFVHDRNQEALAITPSVTPQGASVSATVRF